MVKICEHCFSVFKGNIPNEFCPMADCGGWELIEIDDLMADVIVRFWESGIFTGTSCIGHSYESCFSPFIRFVATKDYYESGESRLDELRDVFQKVNQTRVEIGEIELRDEVDTYSFDVRGTVNTSIDEYRERLTIQRNFIDTLYDSVEILNE